MQDARQINTHLDSVFDAKSDIYVIPLLYPDIFILMYQALIFPFLYFQHRQGAQDHISRAGDPRNGGRGDRLLPWAGHLRALPSLGGATLGGGGRAQ